MGDSDSDWESTNWDEKIKQDQEPVPEPKQAETSPKFVPRFANSTNQGQTSRSPAHRQKSLEIPEIYIQPCSHKQLEKILSFASSSSTFPSLIYETFGQFERWIETHASDLTHESIVDLLIIDVVLLEVPFFNHNQLLLEEISKISSFWKQLVEFLQKFFEHKNKDLQFLMLVDMHGFFDSIELLVHNMLVNNLFNSEMEKVVSDIVSLMEEFKENQFCRVERLKKLLEDYRTNKDVFNIYEIHPKLADLEPKSPISREVKKNIINGRYENVSHYLQTHLPLLKEDFLIKLRDGINHLRNVDASKALRSKDLNVFSKVHLSSVLTSTSRKVERKQDPRQKRESVKVKIPAVKIQRTTNDLSRRLYHGQLLLFSTSKDFTDLILATVSFRDEDRILVNIVSTENVEEVFERDLIMVEPQAFFEPYHHTFNVLKNYNELNFPFKDQILNLEKSKKFPEYEHSDSYTYKNFTFDVEKLSTWPSRKDLGLEIKQLEAVQAAVNQDFTIIQGPPGTGKTFIGLEILKILLDNTKETILILTQTNNALDKFLIGASNFTQSIARLGGQSKAAEIKKFMIHGIEPPAESKKYLTKLYKIKEKTSDGDKQQKYHRLIEEIRELGKFYAIKDKRIVGMTTTYAAQKPFFNKMLKPGIVIVEEASEILESQVLVSLTRETKQLIMIGDHQQLKPKTSSFELGRNFNFNVSLFERLAKNDFDYITLDVQMRMHSDICDLLRGTVYPMLRNGENVRNYPNVKGMAKNFFCINHSEPEAVGGGETSKKNPFEAETIVDICRKLLKAKNEAKQITILTAYAAQAELIKEKLRKNQLPPIKVAILDSFQGEESDIILLSLVRSNKTNDIGFLKEENRVAVVLSRAKFGFYIVANMDCFAERSQIWSKICEILKERDLIGKKIPEDD